jgi:hypothetical protein
MLGREAVGAVALKGEGEVAATGTALAVAAHLRKTRAKHRQ